MWVESDLELRAKQKLSKELGKEEGERLYATYAQMRKAAVEEIHDEIKAVEPDMSDHSAKHVRRVMDNAYKLLGSEGLKRLSGLDMYFLITAIQLHDAGNIFGRKNHEKRTAEIYKKIRASTDIDFEELLILCKIIGAHTGEASDGSKNTLARLDEKTHYREQSIRLRELAAILRFADECEEGPARTSAFIDHLNIADTSKIFHRYAKAVRVSIDRGNGRVALTYQIHIDIEEGQGLSDEAESDLREFIEFIYFRAHKLDQERRYARHYSKIISAFRRTSIVFNFWCNHEPQELQISTVELTDLIVPGEDSSPRIEESEHGYTTQEVIGMIKTHLAADGVEK